MCVSPSRLLGREPAEVTTHHYEDGVLVRSVTVREAEFTAADLALLRGHLRDSREPRGTHGVLLSEAMSRDGDPANRKAKFRWVAALPRTDFVQKAIDDAVDGYRQSYPDADMGSLRWSVEKVDL